MNERKFRVGDVVQAVETGAEFTITAIENRQPFLARRTLRPEPHYVGWWSKRPDSHRCKTDSTDIQSYRCADVEAGTWGLIMSDVRSAVVDLATTLRATYPHGPPDFILDLVDLAKLHSDKNHDYAKGGDPLGNFDRTAQIMRLYPEFPWASPHGSATVQMLKQLDAYLWMQSAKTEAKVEGPDPRLRDIQVFAGIIRIILRRGGGK